MVYMLLCLTRRRIHLQCQHGFWAQTRSLEVRWFVMLVVRWFVIADKLQFDALCIHLQAFAQFATYIYIFANSCANCVYLMWNDVENIWMWSTQRWEKSCMELLHWVEHAELMQGCTESQNQATDCYWMLYSLLHGIVMQTWICFCAISEVMSKTGILGNCLHDWWEICSGRCKGCDLKQRKAIANTFWIVFVDVFL